MKISARDLRTSIIRPCLQALGEYSQDVENLLAGTAMQESSRSCICSPSENAATWARCGLGIFKITTEKHRQIWDDYLIQFPDLASGIRGHASQKQFFNDPHGELISNLNYATAIAWMIYRSAGVHVNNSISKAAKPLDVTALAQLWTMHFDNGTGSARKTADFISTYYSSVSDSECEEEHGCENSGGKKGDRKKLVA